MITKKLCLEKFDAAASSLSDAFRVLEDALPPPVIINTAHGWSPRYRVPSLEHALLMKLARLISITSAIQRLVDGGEVHAQGILQRVSDETGEDIFFLALGKQNGLRSIHRQYLKLFWREEFEAPADPKTYKPRYMVKRSEIRDYIAKQLPPQASIPNGVERMIYGVYSGFVHGASTHIFDLIDSSTGRYRLSGVAHESDGLGYLRDALNYPLRALMAGVAVARALGEQRLADELLAQVDLLQAWLSSGAAEN